MRTDRPAESAFRVQLRRELDRLGWTQSELERRAKLKRGRVSLLLADGPGQRSVAPTADDIRAIADATGVDAAALIGAMPSNPPFPLALRRVTVALRYGHDTTEAMIATLAEAQAEFSAFDLDLGDDADIQRVLFDMFNTQTGDGGRLANVEFHLQQIAAAAGLLEMRLRAAMREIDPSPKSYPRVKSRARPALDSAAELGARLARKIAE